MMKINGFEKETTGVFSKDSSFRDTKKDKIVSQKINFLY